MRLAIISDIHANEVALEAVIKDIKQFGVDQIICLGDVTTLGPHPCSVIQILQDLNCDCILGNHDEFMINPELVHVYTDIPIIVEAITWSRKQLSDADLDFIRTFKKCIEVSPDEISKLLLFHGSPQNHMKDIFSTTPPDELDSMLSGKSATIMACGHTHIQMLRQHKGTLIFNPGSVGLPFKESGIGSPPTILEHAEYAILEMKQEKINVTLRRIPFNKEAFRKAVGNCGGPVREILFQQE